MVARGIGGPHVSALREGSMIRFCRWTFSGIAVMLVFSSACNTAFAQTLEESVSFILSGGRIDLSDIKRIDPDTVSAMTPGGGQKLKVVDRDHCIFHDFDSIYQTDGSQYNFNNIILSETKTTTVAGTMLDGTLGQEVPVIEFHGEDDLHCYPGLCSKSLVITLKPSSAERVTNAIKYVYSNFCTSAKRKSAF
jgi:hypothetical protein